MVPGHVGQLGTTFAALGDETRLRILGRLAGGERTLSELTEPFDMTLTAVSKHVRLLEHAGLVKTEKRGRTRYCRLEPGALNEAGEWIGRIQAFWETRLDALARHLESQDGEGG